MRPGQEAQAALPRATVQGDPYLLQHEPLQRVRTEVVLEARFPRTTSARVSPAGAAAAARRAGDSGVRTRRAEDQGRWWVGNAAVDPEFQDVLNSFKLKIVAGICNDVPPVHRHQARVTCLECTARTGLARAGAASWGGGGQAGTTATRLGRWRGPSWDDGGQAGAVARTKLGRRRPGWGGGEDQAGAEASRLGRR